MEFNLADLFEHAVDHFGDREYVVCDGKRRTYAELEERANRLAHHLAAAGVGPGDHVGIYAYNSVEWVETLWAVFKLRAVWVNINYRYVEDELRYLFENADLVALVFEREFAPRVAGVRDQLPLLRHAVMIEDGSGADASGVDAGDFEEAMAGGSSERDFGPAPPRTATSSTPAAPPGCPRAWCGGTRTCSSPSAAASTSSPAPGSTVPRSRSRKAWARTRRPRYRSPR
jgi:acyl-CoA synthetase (AMP-forming)/AMP-acid ligase II